jgi:hypothetical protein
VLGCDVGENVGYDVGTLLEQFEQEYLHNEYTGGILHNPQSCANWHEVVLRISGPSHGLPYVGDCVGVVVGAREGAQPEHAIEH